MKLRAYVTVDGVDVPRDRIVTGSRNRYGRDRVSYPADPATSTVDLLQLPDDVPSSVAAGSTLEVGIELEDGRRLTRFAGAVTDVSIGLERGARIASIVGTSTALGRMAHRVVGDEPWGTETVGVRVTRVAALAGVTATVVGDDVVELTPVDVDRQVSLGLVQTYTTSGDSILAEYPNTDSALEVHTPELRRAPQTALVIPASLVLVGAVAEQRVETLCNRARVRWGEGNPQAEVLVEDGPSIERYGEYEVSLTTTLATEAAATERASRLVALGRIPAWQFTGVTIDLSHPDVSDELALAILGSRISDRIDLEGVDAEASPATFLEGWEDEIDGPTQWRVVLNLSSTSLTTPAPRWIDVHPATTWAGLPPDLTWIGAAIGPLAERIAA